MSHSQTTGVRRGLTAVSSDAGQRGPAYNNSDTQHLGTINLPPSPGTTLAWYTPAAATLAKPTTSEGGGTTQSPKQTVALWYGVAR